MNYQVTEEIAEQFSRIAQSLPEMPAEYVDTVQEIKGSELMAAGFQEIKLNGVLLKVESLKRYKNLELRLLRNIDHVANLSEQYRKGGMMAVFGYMMNIAEHEHRARLLYPKLFKDNGRGKYRGVATGTIMRRDPRGLEMIKQQGARQNGQQRADNHSN